MTFAFDHVHIFSRDAKLLGDWFETFFDADVQHQEMISKIVVGNLTVLVRPVEGEEEATLPAYGLNHIGLSVMAIDEVYKTFKSKGAFFQMDINTPRPGLRMFFVGGPDNVIVEVLERNERYVPQ